MSEQKEKKYRRIGWISSISVQVLLLILFYFLVAWKEPFPPIPSYGIELSFGVDESGSGEQPVVTQQPIAEEMEQVESSEEPTEEVSELDNPDSEPVTEDVPIEDDITEEVVEPVTEQPSPDQVTSDPVTEPVVEKPKEIKKEPAKETPKEEVKKEEEKQKEEVNSAALMPKSDGEPNDSKGPNNDSGAAGKEEGNIDGRALMGEQGSSNGASLQMSGWVWDTKPQPKDDSDESGKIVYKIKVDGDGYIVGVELLSSTVSPVVEHYYRQSVERLSFSKTNEYSPAPFSTGKITFIIRSK